MSQIRQRRRNNFSHYPKERKKQKALSLRTTRSNTGLYHTLERYTWLSQTRVLPQGISIPEGLDENRKILMVSSKWRGKEGGGMRSEAPRPVQRQMEGFSEVPQRGS